MARIRQPIGTCWKWALGIIGIAILCMFYEHMSNQQHDKNPFDTTIPNLTQLLKGFVDVCTPKNDELKAAFGIQDDSQTIFSKISNTRIYEDCVATYGRLFKGLLWGCLLSVFIGILMGCYEWLAALLLPLLSFLAKVPGTAMLAVFFVMAGTGEAMYSVMIGFGILPTLTQSIYLSAKNEIHEEEINKAYTLGASNFEVIWNVVLRQVLPSIIDHIRLQFGPAMVYLIAAEMLVGQVGLGYQIRMQQRLLNMAIVYDYLIITGAICLLMDYSINKLCGWFCPWYDNKR